MIDVVAAIIKDSKGNILIAQRNLKKSQGGLWEFPGGKVEPNETKEKALIREIKEELDMDIKVDSLFDENKFSYPEKVINLIAFNCSMLNNNYKSLEHEKVEWVTINELDNYEFAPADINIVNKLKQENL